MGKCSSTIRFIAFFILIGIDGSHQSSSSSLPLILVPKVFQIATPETIIILPTSTRDSFVIDIQTDDGTVFTKYCDPPREIEPYQMSITIDQSQTKVNPGTLTQRADFRILGRDGDRISHKIALSYMNGLAFVQTDKPIYTPRDTVKIRMMRLDDKLKPKLEPLRLQIKSPTKIIMDEVTFNYQKNETDNDLLNQSVDTTDPLIDYEFKIPPDPIENTWQVVMSYGPNFGASTNATFVVRRYTLPPFKIKINSPKFISPSSSAVNGSVEVFYLNNGKPITGTARFIFKVKLPSGKIVALGQTSDKELEDGRLTYEFAAEEFKESNLWFPEVEGGQLVVEVVVVELPTGTKIKKTDSSTFFFRQPYKVSFKNSYKTFRSDHPIQLGAEILKHNDQLVSNVRASMWIDEDPVSKKNAKQVISDDLGQIKMEYQLPETLSNAQSITLAVQIISNDSTDEESRIISQHTLRRYNETLTTLTLINRKDRFKVGQTYSNTIIFEGNTSIYQPGIYYSLIVQGKIHTFGKLPANDELRLVISPEMVPAFRLLVFCYRHDRLVSDSILVHVDQEEDCGLSIDYLNSRGTKTAQIQPGENGSLLIKSSPQSHVALRGVDEAIFSLEDESVLTRQELISVLKTKDLGCGPGGGYDSKNIITNSGLLTVGLSEDKYKRETCGNEFDPPKQAATMSRKPKNFKKNRRGRSIGSFRNDDEISSRNLCCEYGKRKDLKGRSCSVRHGKLLELLAYYTNCTNNCHQHSCAIEYLSCCRSKEPAPLFAVAGVTPYIESSDLQEGLMRNRVSLVLAHETYVIADDQLEESTMIRDDFRETWLFDIVKMNDSEEATYPIKVPHSITSWRLDALAVSPDQGLCLLKESVELRSTKILFIRVDLPYSVVQEEQIEMLVTLFNYGPKDLSKVRIYIYGIDDVCSEADPGEKSEPRVLTIKAGSAHTEAFALLPLKPGEYNIKVAAFHSSDLSDIVVKKLHVVPRGIEVLNDYRIQLDPQNRQRRNKRRISDGRLNDVIDANKGEQKTTLNLTQEGKGIVVIPGSERSIISAIANHFTPTNDDAPLRLDHLIRKPGGCGEQNIIYMAPTLLALEFLNSTTMLTVNQSEKGINYLREGYKQQLTFLKEDGSYSAFKKRKSSVWLTGFVLKIFCRSKPYLGDAMDSEVLKLSAQYLIENQHEEGYWIDAKPVLHRNIMGGIVGIPANTAFILNSLQTCASLPIFSNNSKLLDAIEKAEEYLCAQIEKDRQMNAYTMALSVYSLSGAKCLNDSERNSMLIDLKSLSVHDLDQNQLMWPDEPRIETAGYALMAYLRSKTLPNARDYGQAIVNWLESRRTFSGSFDATQDTIVALEALSQFARSQNKGDIDLQCNITSGRYRKHIEFHPYNAQIMQTFEIPGGADDVYIHTKGVGFGSLQVQYKYNILEPKNKLCGYELEVNISDKREQAVVEFDEDDFFEMPKTKEVLGIIKTLGDGPSSNKLDSSDGQEAIKKEPSHLNNLKICVRSSTRDDAGMSIVEAGILSGYEPVIEDLDRLVNQKSSIISKYERLERKITFYLDSIPGIQGQKFCFTFGITQHHFVSNLQSALVRVYDYYAEEEGCSQLYYAVRRTEPLTADCQQNPAVCQCAANSICPVNKNLEEIGEIATYNMKRAHEKMEKFLCSSLYQFVWLGKIQKITEIDKYFKIDFKINHIFRGDQSLDQVVTLMIDLRCVLSQTVADDPANLRFLVMGRKFEDNIFIDSRSIFMDLKRKEARRSEASVRRIIDDIQSPEGEKMNCPVPS